MLKKQYTTPKFQFYEVKLEQTILSRDVEKMNQIDGVWEEDDE